jgi:hypothetical protein
VAADGRRQLKFRFNLDVNKLQDRIVAGHLLGMKAKRRMTTIIRDAIRLYVDLSRGNVDVLGELFPEIVLKLQAQNTDRVGQALQSLAQSQALMAEAMMNKAPAPAPKPMALQPVTPTAADDDDMPALVMRKAASDGKAASANFLASAFALVD